MSREEELVELAITNKMVAALAVIICDTPWSCPPMDPTEPCANPGTDWNRERACELCWAKWARKVSE